MPLRVLAFFLDFEKKKNCAAANRPSIKRKGQKEYQNRSPEDVNGDANQSAHFSSLNCKIEELAVFYVNIEV